MPYKAPPGYPSKAPPTPEENRLTNERLALAKANERRRLTDEVERARTCPPQSAPQSAATGAEEGRAKVASGYKTFAANAVEQ